MHGSAELCSISSIQRVHLVEHHHRLLSVGIEFLDHVIDRFHLLINPN